MSTNTNINYEDFLMGIMMLHDEYQDAKWYFNINDELALANMSCITDSNHVLLATSAPIQLSLIISYLYQPNRLFLYHSKKCIQYKKHHRLLGDNIQSPPTYTGDNFTTNSIHNYYNFIAQLFDEYHYTTPITLNHVSTIKNIKKSRFDVIFFSYYTQLTPLTVRYQNRFDMLLGEEYDAFSVALDEGSKKLNHLGRFIILVRACWILPVWEKLISYRLQFEYQNYNYYLQSDSHHNRMVWLRFSYHEDGIDEELQKRNVLQFMKDNNIDRLFAHKNNYRFPYVTLMENTQESYVNLSQNRDDLQYFFTTQTTKELTKLCVGYTACLVVPSIAVCAYENNKNIVLFEMDNRFRNIGEMKFVKYDLNKGLHSLTNRKYGKKFNTVLCDPPFNINLNVLAKDIIELLKESIDSCVYIVYPKSRLSLLASAMKTQNLKLVDCKETIIEYSKPPKLVRMEGIDAIQLYKFILS